MLSGRLELENNFFLPFSELEISRKKLGAGSFGSVYCGKWNGKPVAVKKMHFLRGAEEYKKRYTEHNKMQILGEAQKLCGFRHPNIVDFFGITQNGDVHYLVMKLHEEGDLRNRIKKILFSSSGVLPFTLEEKLRISLGVSQAIQYLQKKKIVHRDLRPGNILLYKDHVVGRCVLSAKVCDFGLTRFTTVETNMSKGLPYFVAPENKISYDDDRTLKTPTLESDIYSLGMTLGCIFSTNLPDQLAHGESLFDGEYEEEAVERVMKMAKRCIAKDPSERCKIGEVVDTLDRLLRDETVVSETRRRKSAEEELKKKEEINEIMKKQNEEIETLRGETDVLRVEKQKLEEEIEVLNERFEKERVECLEYLLRTRAVEEKLKNQNEEIQALKDSLRSSEERLAKQAKDYQRRKDEDSQREKELKQAGGRSSSDDEEVSMSSEEYESEEVTDDESEVDSDEESDDSASGAPEEEGGALLTADETEKTTQILLDSAHNCFWGLSGANVDHKRTLQIYEDVVKSGGILDGIACRNLALIYGEKSEKRDRMKKQRYTKMAVEFYSSFRNTSDLTATDLATFGRMLLRGSGFQRNETKGVLLLERAVEMGNSLGMYFLGRYCKKRGGVVNISKSVQLFQDAAEDDSFPYPLFELGKMFRNGRGAVKKDEELSHECYSRAAAKGMRKARKAMYKVGLDYFKHGRAADDETSTSLRKAKKWLLRAYELGDEKAGKQVKKLKDIEKRAKKEKVTRNLLQSAHNYVWGLNGESIDCAKAKELYENVVVVVGGKLDGIAYFNLAWLHTYEYGVKEDSEKYRKYCQNAFDFYSTQEMGDLTATDRATMGIMYVIGRGFKKNETKGVALLEQAVQTGNLLAMFYLGFHFSGKKKMKGGGGLKRCVELYEEAAKRGFPIAMNQLGNMYANGRGVKKDQKRSFGFHLEAAEKGVRKSMLKVAEGYRIGEGVEKNEKETKRWLKKASELEVRVMGKKQRKKKKKIQKKMKKGNKEKEEEMERCKIM